MEQQKVCALCGREYSLKPVNRRPCSDMLKLFLMNRKRVTVHEYNICPQCALKLHKFILDIQRGRPTKCFFCEHDRGPLAKSKPQCETCFNFKNFQVKKNMHPRQSYEWYKFKQREGDQQ